MRKHSMQRLMLGLVATTAVVVASPALARDGYGYFGADIGYADPESHSAKSDNITIHEEDGFELGAFLGYDWGALRTEAEVAYMQFDPDFAEGPFVGPNPVDLAGENKLTTAMVNALFDIGGNDGIGLSLGAGVGRAFLDSSISDAGGA